MVKWLPIPYTDKCGVERLPDDGETVYVRRAWPAQPYLATWDLASATFTNVSGLIAPWYAIAEWRDDDYVPPPKVCP